MIKNFILIAIRNLKKNGLYSFINISGLSIGIVCSILILLWVADEVSFDTFHPKVDRLYQVYVNAEFDGSVVSWSSVPLPTYEEMKLVDSNIKNSAVAGWGADRLLAFEDSRIIKHGYFVSNEFLEMFEFPLITGNADAVLDDPSSIVISESLAKILFKDKNPINQLIKVDDQSLLKVTGIVKDVPGNSSFEFDYLIPWKHRESVNPWIVRNKTNWGNYSFQVFIELNDASNADAVEDRIKGILTEKGQDDVPREFFIHPMLKWRLYSNFEDGVAKGGMSDYVQLFSVMAILILVIACINFMNLSTARSEKRAREVGIRKSLGSNRTQLIFQFIGESLFISLIAFSIAIILAEALLPFYNDLVDKKLIIDYASANFWLFSMGVIFFTGIVSGSYPAFYLSAFRPVATLKGNLKSGKNATLPRKILVVLQFGFAILLMISTVVIYQQIELAKDRSLGYKQENLITVPSTDEIDNNFNLLKTELIGSGTVSAVTQSNSSITSISSNNFLGWPGKPESQKVMFTTIVTEYDYAKTMGIKILHGRDFSREFRSDSSAIVINKAALDIMGLKDPIGTSLNLWGEKRKLIGVIDDVLMGSPYRKVKPMFMIMDKWGPGVVTVRLNKTNDLKASLATVQSLFEKHNPAYPFDYTFADEDFQRKFTTINLTHKIATLFSILAIFITGLGLFGLASFTAQQRIKEIGIRKVLGASVSNLIALISKDFAMLVVLAFMISAPITWYLLSQYLERYPIHIDMQWWIFPLIGIVALSFALAIVINQARRAAQANPVQSLRNE